MPRAPHSCSRGSRKEKTRPLVSPPRRRTPEGRGAGGGARRRAAPPQPRICFRFRPDSGKDAGRRSFGSGRKSAGDRRGRAAGLPGTGARKASGLQIPTALAPPEPASRFPGPASASRPRGSASRRAATCARLLARRAAHYAAGPREVRAPCMRGVARDTAAAGSALCVFPNRGRTCLHPSPRPLSRRFHGGGFNGLSRK